MIHGTCVVAFNLLSLLPAAGAPRIDVDPVLQNKVDLAVRKGVQTLKAVPAGAGRHGHDPGMLVLLTLLHAGVPDSDPRVQELLARALDSELKSTYTVALTAMALEELDRAAYLGRIQQCAQFLVDNIGPDGQTRYGEPTTLPKVEKTESKAAAVQTGNKPDAQGQVVLGAGGRTKPKVVRTLLVKQQRPGPKDHDHSNMQYAALGLRACYDAGIRFEPGLIKKVETWWRGAKKKTEDPAEALLLDPPPAALQGRSASTRAVLVVKAAPSGWGYYKGRGEAIGSMTAGAVGALCILDYLQEKDWRQDEEVLEGLQWISKHFSVSENPGVGNKNFYYYLYGLERAGMLFGTETIGSHKWYPEGAEALLALQQADGGWGSDIDTCFAILFLTRATRKLVVYTG